jgi:hypothetical protein
MICSSETSVLTRATRRHIPDDSILHSHSRENLKFYISEHMYMETTQINKLQVQNNYPFGECRLLKCYTV